MIEKKSNLVNLDRPITRHQIEINGIKINMNFSPNRNSLPFKESKSILLSAFSKSSVDNEAIIPC